VVNRKVTNEGAATADVIAAMIRQCSKSGRLISEFELRGQFIEQHQPPFVDQDADIQSMLAKTLQQHDDLHELPADDNARYYYSSQGMTQAYALMLLQKLGDPARLIAEVIRQNSASYPRPVPLDMFTNPPFDLTREQVVDCLERMTVEEDYRDIASTTTSASTIFLYSTLHLEPEHASMLAEWFDVGQLENP
jgi:hypothetical protein